MKDPVSMRRTLTAALSVWDPSAPAETDLISRSH